MVQDQQPQLTIVTWLWDGWRPVYDYTHVNAMARMLAAFCSVPHRVICVTDMPANIECETFPLWDIDFKVLGINATPVQGRVVNRGERGLMHYPNSYRRLKLFSPWAAEQFPGKVLSIDLDAVILNDLAPLLTDQDFRINEGKCCPYNGGMWLHRTGTRLHVWERLDQNAFRKTSGKGYIGSDQAWLAHSIPGEATWNRDHGVYHFSHSRPGEDFSECRVMFTAGGTKPWHPLFASKFPELAAAYRRFL